MAPTSFHMIINYIQQSISLVGTLIILIGVVLAVIQYLQALFTGAIAANSECLNTIRLKLGRILVLGLEFIIAGDLIATTTTPDYYTVGILAIIVAIRTFLSFALNKELVSLGSRPA